MTLESEDSVVTMLRDCIEKLRSPDPGVRGTAVDTVEEIVERVPGRLPVRLLQAAGERLFAMTSTEPDSWAVDLVWRALMKVAYRDPAVDLPWDAVCERAASLPPPLLQYATSILVAPTLPRFRGFFERLATHPDEAVRQEAVCGLQALDATPSEE